MTKPRTALEIAERISACGAITHASSIACVFAEHEAAIAELEARCDNHTQMLRALPGCESGEGEGQTVAAPVEYDGGQRAPDSTAPAPSTEQVERDARRLATHLYRSQFDIEMASRVRALAADRDRLARIVAKDQEWAALASCNSVEEMHAELGHQIGQRREAVSDRNLLADNLEEMQRERDALQRRIDEMATREPTPTELGHAMHLYTMDHGSVSQALRWWRDALLATPASEPSEGPRCDHHAHSWHGPLYAQVCSGCGETMLPTAVSIDAPQPSPATPSAEDVVRWEDFVRLNAYMVNWGGRSATDFARALAAEVARREAGLRTERDAFERHADEYRAQRDEARAQLAAATDPDPERERLIAECVKAGVGQYWNECATTAGNLADYERKRRGES